MKTLITMLAVGAIFAGFGAQEAKAENFFKKASKFLKERHEDHKDILREAHERHTDNGRGRGRRGHYETREVKFWVEGRWVIEYVEVREPGHFENQTVEVVVPGYYKTIEVPAEYRYERDHCGRTVKVLVRPAYCKKVWVPETVRCETKRVWVEGECKRVAKKCWKPGHYETRTERVWCD